MTHSVIIVTRNRHDDLRVALAALAGQTKPPDEVIVVDASDQPLMISQTNSTTPRLVVIDAAPSIPAQRNIGLANAKGDIVSFLDDDAVPEPAFYEKILHRFALDIEGRIGGIGGSMTGERARPSPELLFRRLFLIQTTNGNGRFRLSGIPDPVTAAAVECEVSILSSGGCSFRHIAVAGLRFEEYWCTGAALGLATGRGFAEDMLFSADVSGTHQLIVLPDARYAHHASPRSRETTETTQALYVFAMRYVSRKFRPGGVGKACRIWALIGQGLLNLMQAAWYRDPGYLHGYLRAMRVRLP